MGARAGALAVFALAVLCSTAAGQGARADIGALLAAAEHEANAGRLDKAIDLARQVVAQSPKSAAGFFLLARCHTARNNDRLYDREEALACYAQALAIGLPPEQEPPAKAAIKRLYYSGPPPRYVRPEALDQLPGKFVEGAVPVTDERLPAQCRRTMVICRSTGLKYPQGGVVRKGEALFNRVASAYVLEPSDEEQRMWECVRVYFPSPTLSREGADYAELAQRVLDLYVRLYCIGRAYLGGGELPSEAAPLKVWLVEGERAEAEKRWEEIFLYGINVARTPLEWVRQICHEYGHFELRPVGPFDEPETWANGVLGEALFSEWLWRNSPDGVVQWGEEKVDLGKFLSEFHARLIQRFFIGKPRSRALADTTEVGFEHFLGMALYAQAVLPPLKFRELLYATERPRSADFHDNFRAIVDKLDPPIFKIPGGLFFQKQSQANEQFDYVKLLSLAPHTGARQPLRYWVYLPQGRWSVALRVRPPKEYADPIRYFLTLTSGREGKKACERHTAVNPQATLIAADLGPLPADWYLLTFAHDCTEGCALESLTFSRRSEQ